MLEGASEFQTYSLAQVGGWLCGDDMKNPDVWVYRRILNGTFSGIKVGGKYRMTREQVAAAMETLVGPKEEEAPSVPEVEEDLLTVGSRRRRRK